MQTSRRQTHGERWEGVVTDVDAVVLDCEDGVVL